MIIYPIAEKSVFDLYKDKTTIFTEEDVLGMIE
jgi:hypothetical protein